MPGDANPELPGLLLGLLCSASLLAWIVLLIGQYGTLFPQREPCPEALPRAALIPAAALLLLLLLDPLIEASHRLQGLPPLPTTELTITSVQTQCGANLAMTAVLLVCLGSGPGGLRSQGVYLCPLRPQLRDAAIGFLLAIGPVFALLAASFFTGLRGTEPEHQLLRLLEQQGSLQNWLWITLTAAVAAPLAEELLFRLLLQGALLEVVRPAFALGTTAVLFCAVHKFPDSLALLPLAGVLGWIHFRRRSYLTLVGIHALFNGLNLLLTALQP